MSYWTWMEIDTGGPENAAVTDSINSTSNHSAIWSKALGMRFRDLKGKTGTEARPLLQQAIAYLKEPDNQRELQALAPSNGWGSIESAAAYLSQIGAWCEQHPNATINMSY